mmetsp:Transcript_1842/g.2748  ORF Transcript_1842/g.2748 Transcript_1842/m.2748 type:complete len:95 (+) Transcript_1842:2175-2459(+)
MVTYRRYRRFGKNLEDVRHTVLTICSLERAARHKVARRVTRVHMIMRSHNLYDVLSRLRLTKMSMLRRFDEPDKKIIGFEECHSPRVIVSSSVG